MKEYLLRIIGSLVIIFFAGMFNAVHDIAGNKAWYNISIFPANEPGSFWGHTNDTWQNKWARSEAGEVLVGKERFWLSSTALVWITDLWHASKSLMILAFQIALLLYRWPAKRIFYLTDLVLVKLAFSGGWHVSAWILM
jgi:hypothetical protein